MSTTLSDNAIKQVADLALRVEAFEIVEASAPGSLATDQPFGERRYLLTRPELKVEDITDRLLETMPYPKERRGIVKLTSLSSFSEYVNRMKESSSVIFSDLQERKLTTIFDYHERVYVDPASVDPTADVPAPAEARPRWGRFRAVYEFPPSPQWLAWHGQNKSAMNQADLASFIEDNIDDIQPVDTIADPKISRLQKSLGLNLADPLKLLQVARGLSIKVDQKVQNVVNITTGETQIQFVEEHTPQGQAKEDVKVPSGFIITIPVFEGDAAYQLLVRLKYRVADGRMKWFFDIYNIDRAEKHAFETSCQRVMTEVSLPMFAGSPS